MEKGAHEKITSDPRLRLKVHHADLRHDKDNTFDPEQFKSDYQVKHDASFFAIYVYVLEIAFIFKRCLNMKYGGCRWGGGGGGLSVGFWSWILIFLRA